MCDETRMLRITGWLAGAMLVLWLAGCASTNQVSTDPKLPVVKPVKKAPPKRVVNYYALPDGSLTRPYKIGDIWYQPLAHASGFRQQGFASWYGEAFHGRRTSSGEIYNMHEISAAHTVLPLGTVVLVKNIENGKKLQVKINDRGPFVPGRIIDLSYAAARELGVYASGTAEVEVTAIGTVALKPEPPDASSEFEPIALTGGNYAVQVGAFGTRDKAEQLVKTLRLSEYRPVYVKPTPSHQNRKTIFRVLVGNCATETQAAEYERMLKARGFPKAFLIAE